MSEPERTGLMQALAQALITPSAPGFPALAGATRGISGRSAGAIWPGNLLAHIARLEEACRERPESADLHACLGNALGQLRYVEVGEWVRSRELVEWVRAIAKVRQLGPAAAAGCACDVWKGKH